MNILTAVFSGILFFVLTPNILLRLPKKGNKFTVAAVHAIVFGLVLYFVQGFVYRMSLNIEGFTDEQCTLGSPDDEGEYQLNENGECVKKNVEGMCKKQQ
jgi:hypothetical protein